MAPSLSPAALPAVTRPCGAERRLAARPGPPPWCRGAAARRRWPGPSRSRRRAGGAPAPGRAGSCRRRTPAASLSWLATAKASARSLVRLREAVVQVLGGRAHDQGGGVDQLLGRRSAGWGRRPRPSGGGPCARRRRRWRRRRRRRRCRRRVVVTAVIAPAHIRSIGVAGHGLRQAGQQGGRPADGQALVADLGGRGDGDLVDPLGRQLGVAAQQLADAVDDQVVGAGLGVHALLAGLAERGADAVDEDDVTQGAGHGASSWTAVEGGHGSVPSARAVAGAAWHGATLRTGTRDGAHPPGAALDG